MWRVGTRKKKEIHPKVFLVWILRGSTNETCRQFRTRLAGLTRMTVTTVPWRARNDIHGPAMLNWTATRATPGDATSTNRQPRRHVVQQHHTAAPGKTDDPAIEHSMFMNAERGHRVCIEKADGDLLTRENAAARK